MDRRSNEPIDTRDTTLNGMIVGAAVTVMAWFLFTGLNKLVPLAIPEMTTGFSDSLIAMMAIVANILPVQMFNSQSRGLAMRGVMGILFLGILVWALYFKLGVFS